MSDTPQRNPVMKLGLVPQTDAGAIFFSEKNHRTVISSLRVHNTVDSPFTVWLYLRHKGAEEDDEQGLQLLATYQLDAGDSITDSTRIEFADELQLWAKSNLDTVSYSISGWEEPLK